MTPTPSAVTSAAGLVEVLHIARSTLVRDLKTLREAFNAPIKPIKERGGWGYTEKAAYLPNIFISEGDLTILCASWGALERRRNTAWRDRVRPVMERLMTLDGASRSSPRRNSAICSAATRW